MKPTYMIRKHRMSSRHSEAGVALIMALICVLVISMLAAGVVFSTQTELWTTANYRQVTQARYVAEAGAQQAANWIIQNWTPPANFTDTTQFNLSVFPALYVGGSTPSKIVLASTTMGAITDTYGNITGGSTLDNNFKTALHAISTPFTAVPGGASFDVAVQLLSATQDLAAGQWVTKWKIISQGTVTGFRNAKVQVVEVIADVPQTTTSSQTVPNFNYAVLATGTGCGVVSMSGGQYTNAYNSTASGNPGNANPTLLGTGGSVASFGNISVTNGAYINGNVYSPYYNAGAANTYGISCQPWSNAPDCHNANGINNGTACSSPSTMWSVNEDNSNSAVGCTNSSTASCSQQTANLPPSLPNPSSVPNATMPNVASNTAACSGFNGLCNGGSGGGSGCAITIPPNPSGNYGVTNFGSCARITLQAGIYNFDTLYISNGAQVILPANASVVINIFNASNAATPLNVDGGTVANNGGDPNNLTFVYDGTKTINLAAGANMFATVYAPNAPVTVSGNAGLYGAIVGKTFSFSGSGHVIYDTHLASEAPNVTYGGTTVSAAAHVDEFSWSAY
jgi:Tfp pilus assembly protein PilX